MLLMFSDEGRFNLGFNDRKANVWNTVGERYLTECLSLVRKNTLVSVRVWGCLGYHGVEELVVVKENISGEVYVNILTENLHQSVENIYGAEMHPSSFSMIMLLHAHTCHLTQQWLDENDVQPMWRSTQSPDLNIIENVWDVMGKRILTGRPTNRAWLIISLQHAWNNMTIDYIQQLYDSMP
jgi:hypothetical protein